MSDQTGPAVLTTVDATEPPAAPQSRLRLGEELPIFCEKCGYHLHGLEPVRCQQCDLLHFCCPECGHRQAINTLRPAVQRILGRVRASVLVLLVFLRVNYFGWLLFAWGAMGAMWSYQWQYTGTAPPYTVTCVTWPLSYEMCFSFGVLGLVFGAVSRMLLLRWRRGVVVGVTLAAVVLGAVRMGAWLCALTAQRGTVVPPLGFDFYAGAGVGCGCVALGAAVAWPIWVMLVRAFLPARAAGAVLGWQRSLSMPASLARE